MKDTGLHFKGTSEDKLYELDIEFYEKVDAEGSTYKTLDRSVQMHIMKAKKEKDDDDGESFWPRLLKDKALEKNQVTVDWNRYVDEDEEDDAGGFDMSALEGGMGMGGGMPPGMGGMGGMGGMDMEALMKQMGGMGAMPPGEGGLDAGHGGDDDSDDGDDDGLDDLPDLEES